MTDAQHILLQHIKPDMVWHQYHTYLCILGSDNKLTFSSNLEDTRKHPAYLGLVLMGNSIILFLQADVIHMDYEEGGWERIMLLHDLVPGDEQPTFPPEVAGRIKDLWAIWREWALKDWL